MKTIFALLCASVFLLTGCASVPPEVVALSNMTSNDTRALHEGYRSLVRKHFVALRKTREQEFADKVLAPYIDEAIKEGRLIDVVQGKVVWDSGKDGFVEPDTAKATVQKLDTLATWNRQVALDIENLRKDAFEDLVKQENDVLDAVDQAFGNVNRGNNAIHGYLLSLQKVDAAQNEFFKTIGLEGFPKKVDEALDKASTDAAKYSEKIKGIDDKTMALKQKLKKTGV